MTEVLYIEGWYTRKIKQKLQILVIHIPAPRNPGDIMTKEHKCDKVYWELRDLIVF